MSKLFLFILELLRLIIIVMLGSAFLASFESLVYEYFGINLPEVYGYVALANFIIMIVFYKNYFQFKGWYKSSQNKKIPKRLTRVLIGSSVVAIMMPIIENYFF